MCGVIAWVPGTCSPLPHMVYAMWVWASVLHHPGLSVLDVFQETSTLLRWSLSSIVATWKIREVSQIGNEFRAKIQSKTRRKNIDSIICSLKCRLAKQAWPNENKLRKGGDLRLEELRFKDNITFYKNTRKFWIMLKPVLTTSHPTSVSQRACCISAMYPRSWRCHRDAAQCSHELRKFRPRQPRPRREKIPMGFEGFWHWRESHPRCCGGVPCMSLMSHTEASIVFFCFARLKDFAGRKWSPHFDVYCRTRRWRKFQG